MWFNLQMCHLSYLWEMSAALLCGVINILFHKFILVQWQEPYVRHWIFGNQ